MAALHALAATVSLLIFMGASATIGRTLHKGRSKIMRALGYIEDIRND